MIFLVTLLCPDPPVTFLSTGVAPLRQRTAAMECQVLLRKGPPA